MYPQREVRAPCHLCRTFCRTIRDRRLLSTFFVANTGSAVPNMPGADFNSQMVLHILQGSSTWANPTIVLYTYVIRKASVIENRMRVFHTVGTRSNLSS
jgi:hypothetical protein